jgi:SulP family sulfate permease
MFRPKLVDTLKGYTARQFRQDLIPGVIVALVALPLAIAFGIASGVSPEKGLYTAIIGGFVISALGGSRVQIGGPTGAFIIIVYGIVQTYGVAGLAISTVMAGVMLVVMGFARLGSVIKFIPYSLTIGFTSGIALIIFSSQVKDLFGLRMGSVPADFLGKWQSYGHYFRPLQWENLLVGLAAVVIIAFWPKITYKIPGSIVAIILTTVGIHLLHLPVETIGSRFGPISASLPRPGFPYPDLALVKALLRPAFTIALLGGIESLLSAVIADGMMGGEHRSNTELIAQGAANILAPIFGGIPATGAIARTATNVKNGGRTPVAGMVHAITLLLIVLFFGKWAAWIPMATLAGILVVVAYNMSEWRHFRWILGGPRSDIAILLTTFLLTVLVDLTVAIEVGMVLAAFLFVGTMVKSSSVSLMRRADKLEATDPDSPEPLPIPKDTEVFEISGPLFFGAAYKFKDAMRYIEKDPKVLIIRMQKVPVIDATGIRTIKELHQLCKRRGTRLILSEIDSVQVLKQLKDARLLFAIGKANITRTFSNALQRSSALIQQKA